MEDLILRPSLKKDVQDRHRSDMEVICFSSSQFIPGAKSDERQPADPQPLDESGADVNDCKRVIDGGQRVSRHPLRTSIDRQYPAGAQPADKSKTEGDMRKISTHSEEEERIVKRPPVRPPPTVENIAAGDADARRLSISDYEEESDEENESDEWHIELESTQSRLIASAPPTRTPLPRIAEESDCGIEEGPLPSLVAREHIEYSAPFGPCPTPGTDSLDFDEVTPLKTISISSGYTAVNAPSETPSETLPLPEGCLLELSDSSLGSAVDNIKWGIDHEGCDEFQEIGRARRTTNPIFEQGDCEDQWDPPEREVMITATLESKETVSGIKRVQTQPSKVFLKGLRWSAKKVSAHKDASQHSIVQRSKSTSLPTRNVPVKQAPRRVAQSSRYLDRNLLSLIRKAQKPPPLPPIEDFPSRKLNWRSSAPSLPPRTDALIKTRPRRIISSPFPECKTSKLKPRSDFVPPPSPVKDMRIPPLPNQPKLLIPKLYEDKNEAGRDCRSSQVRQSKKSKGGSKKDTEPLMMLESLKPKYYDPKGRPVSMLIPNTIW